MSLFVVFLVEPQGFNTLGLHVKIEEKWQIRGGIVLSRLQIYNDLACLGCGREHGLNQHPFTVACGGYLCCDILQHRVRKGHHIGRVP